MANPRQRRKARSGHRRVSQSLRSRKNMKKPPPVKAPKILQDAWDPKKTVRQNYAAMGLMTSLNPTTSGGVEIRQPTGVNDSSSSTRTLDQVEQEPSQSLRKGFGRIVRDADGNVIDVELPEDDDENGETDEEAPAGVDNEDEWRGIAKTSDWVTALRNDPEGGESEVIQELKQMVATAPEKPGRYTSGGERGYLDRLVAKYGRDIEAMARDQRLNVQQYSVGQLRKALRKAKLFADF